jgi:hypothetical protein
MSLACDIYINFETGNDGDATTTAVLNASTRGSGLGSWNNDNVNGTISTAASRSIGLVTAGGVTYSGGTRGFAYDHNTTPDNAWAVFDADHDIISFGFDITFGNHDHIGAAQNFDLFTVGDTYGNQSATLSYYSQAGNNRISAHQATLPVQHGDYITIDYTKPYWVTMKWIRNDKAIFNIYEKNGFVFIGTSSVAISDYPVRVLSWGTGGYGANEEGITLWDNIVIDWTNATFPLLPDIAKRIMWRK